MKRLLFLLFLVSHTWVYGQTAAPTPAQTLRLARATYEQGRLHEIPTQLDDKVIAQMTKQEKVEAYKILCLSYIYLEEPGKADESMLNILNTDPYFQINPAVDPAEFVSLYKTFRRTPIVRVGVSLGGNLTQPNVTEVVNTVSGATGEFKFKFGLQFGASADYPLSFLSDRLTLHGDLFWQQKKFDLTSENDQGDGEINSTLATENQTWLSFPISVQFNLLKQNELTPRKLNPYIALGFSTDLNLGSKLTIERTREGETSVEPKNIDIKSQRENLNMSLIGAAGVKTRFAGGLIGVELRFIYGLTNVNNAETAYTNTDLYNTYGLPQSIFKLNSASFAVTYVQNIFKPIKLKRHK